MYMCVCVCVNKRACVCLWVFVCMYGDLCRERSLSKGPHTLLSTFKGKLLTHHFTGTNIAAN